MGTTVRVTNLATNQSVVAKITDRGPFVEGRTLDLSLAAAKEIGVYRAGVAKVQIEVFAHPGSDPEGRWCVQIGAFLDQADAVQTKNDLLRALSDGQGDRVCRADGLLGADQPGGSPPGNGREYRGGHPLAGRGGVAGAA